MKLMIAVPTLDYVHADFMNSLQNLTAELSRKGISHTVEIITGTLVYFARNKLASKAVNEGYTHVLWLDSDMVFGETIAEDLMFCGKEMVCGAFVARRPMYSPCVYESIRSGDVRRVTNFGTEPFRVDGCGFACVMTAVSLLKDVFNKYGTCFMPTPDYGEDLAFCWRVKGIGREIWCDPTVRPGHIAHIPIYVGDEIIEHLQKKAGGL